MEGVSQIEQPNLFNREGETIINIIFQCIASIELEVLRQDETIFDFFYEVTKGLIALRKTSTVPDDETASNTNHRVSTTHANPHLYSHTLDVNHRSKRHGQCPLHTLLSFEHERYAFQFLLLLLDANVDLALPNEDGSTFLHMLVRSYFPYLEIESSSKLPIDVSNRRPFFEEEEEPPLKPPPFEGQRLQQVFHLLLLQPLEGWKGRNWCHGSGDCWRVDSKGRTFLQLERELYLEATTSKKKNDTRLDESIMPIINLPMTTICLEEDTSQNDLPDVDSSLTDSPYLSPLSPPVPPVPSAAGAPMSPYTSPPFLPATPWSRIDSIHACCIEFETQWLNEIRPKIGEDLEDTFRRRKRRRSTSNDGGEGEDDDDSNTRRIVGIVLNFIDGYV